MLIFIIKKVESVIFIRTHAHEHIVRKTRLKAAAVYSDSASAGVTE